jgi:hypothetical protein
VFLFLIFVVAFSAGSRIMIMMNTKPLTLSRPTGRLVLTKCKPLAAVLALALGSGFSGANAQELFTNGNMQTFVNQGVNGFAPTGWAINAFGAQAPTNSPFLNAYANNGLSFELDDIGDGTSGASQAFSTTTNYQSVTVNFDFMMPVLTPGQGGGAWGIQFDGGGASGLPSSAVHYRIDLNGAFAINAGPGGGVITNIVSLVAGSWYNVQATFDVTAINDGSTNGAGVQSGSITEPPPLGATWPRSAPRWATAGSSCAIATQSTRPLS